MSRFQKSDLSVTKAAFVYFVSGQISDIVNEQRFTTFARPSLRRCRTLPCLPVGISGCPSIFNTYTITGAPFCEPNHIIQLFNHGSQSCRLGITSTGDYIFSPNVVRETLRLVNIGLCGARHFSDGLLTYLLLNSHANIITIFHDLSSSMQ